MKLLGTILALSLLACGQLSQAAGNVDATIGSRQLKNIWEPIEHQTAIGVDADFALGALPVYASVGLHASAAREDEVYFDFSGAVVDISAGLKAMPRSGLFRPYVGAGVARIGASFKADSNYSYYADTDDSDRSFGYYAAAGALFRIGRHLNVGFDLRWTGGTDIKLFGVDGNANSFTGSVQVGYGWD